MTPVYVLVLIAAISLGVSFLIATANRTSDSSSNGYSATPWMIGGAVLLVLAAIAWVMHVAIATAH